MPAAPLPPLPSPLVYPLEDNARLVELLADATGKTRAAARQLLYREQRSPLDCANAEFYARGLEPGVWSERLLEYYSHTPSFLCSGIVWNRNPEKVAMRRWIGEHLRRAAAGPLQVLCYGDGPGFDSLYLAQCGHDVTYFEVSDRLIRFAQGIFRASNAAVRVLPADERIESAGFDVVVCLDVLEHVPHPRALIGQLASYLRPGGRFVVHAPFFFVSPRMPTHLRSNLQYSGTLSLYRRLGLRLVDGRTYWAPLVFGRNGPQMPRPAGLWQRTRLRLSGLPLLFSRFWPQPLSRHAVRMWRDDPRWEEGLTPGKSGGRRAA
jgi:SAM-dependent methyltransferase